MNTGSYVLSQLAGLIVRHEFSKCFDRYDGDYKVKDFNCWNQFLCMMFGQLTHRESITDIITCLEVHDLHLVNIAPAINTLAVNVRITFFICFELLMLY